MSYYNPYDQSGLSEGFAKGFQLALDFHAQRENIRLKKQEMALAQQKEAREQGLTQAQIAEMQSRQKLTDIEGQYLPQKTQAEVAGLQAHAEYEKQHGEVEKALVPVEQAKAEAEKASAAAAQTHAAVEKYGMDTKKRAELLASARDRLAGIPIDDPTYENDIQAVDAFVTHGINSKLQPQQVYNAFNGLFNSDLKKGVGDEIDSKGAKLHHVPAGSVIVGKKVNDVWMDPQNNDAVLGLEVQYRTKDGKLGTYNSVITKDRSSSPDDQILRIPQDHLQATIRGGAAMAQIAQQLKAQGVPPDQLREMVQSQLSGIAAANPQDIKTNRGGFYSPLTGQFINTGPDNIQQNYLKESAGVDSNPNLTPQMKKDAHDAIDKRYSLAGAGPGMSGGGPGTVSQIPPAGQPSPAPQPGLNPSNMPLVNQGSKAPQTADDGTPDWAKPNQSGMTQ